MNDIRERVALLEHKTRGSDGVIYQRRVGILI